MSYFIDREAAVVDDSRKDDSLLSGEDDDLASSSSSEGSDQDISLVRSIPLPQRKRSSHVLGSSEDEDHSKHSKKKKRAIPTRPRRPLSQKFDASVNPGRRDSVTPAITNKENGAEQLVDEVKRSNKILRCLVDRVKKTEKRLKEVEDQLKKTSDNLTSSNSSCGSTPKISRKKDVPEEVRVSFSE